MPRPRLLVALSLALIATVVFTQPAEARRGRGYNNAAAARARRQAAINAAQAQYAAAERVMQAAQSSGSAATAQLQHVLGVMTTAADGMREAVTDIRGLQKDLRETEEDILREQSADSPYVTKSHELAEVKREMAAIERRLLEAPAYLSTVEQVRVSGGGSAVAKLRQTTLESDHDYTALKLKLEAITSEMSKIRHELFGADNEWNTIREHLAQAQKEADTQSAQVYAHAPERAKPIEQIKDAKEAIAVASALKNQAMMTLQSLGASTKPTSSSKSKNK
jgi:chromosome segregation ATPase